MRFSSKRPARASAAVLPLFCAAAAVAAVWVPPAVAAETAAHGSSSDLLPGAVETAAALDSLPPLRPQGGISFAPEALAVDALGRLFACDRAAGTILRYSPESGWTRFGVGDQGGARYANLTDLFARWGPDLFALDPAAAMLYQFDLNGRLRRSISYRAGLEAARLGYLQPADFALTRAGELLLLDRSGGHLLLFDRFGSFVTDWASGAVGQGRLQSPVRMEQDTDGQLFLLDPPGGWVRRFSRQGTPRPAWRYSEGLPSASGGTPLLAVTPSNQVVVAGRDGSWVRFFDPEGKLLLDWRNPRPPKDRFSDLAAGPDSILYLSSPKRGEVLRLRWRLSQDDGAADE